jgi:hypothetical protein
MTQDDAAPKKRERPEDYFFSRRFDVVTKVLEADSTTGTFEILIEPDPRCYEPGQGWQALALRPV